MDVQLEQIRLVTLIFTEIKLNILVGGTIRAHVDIKNVDYATVIST